MQISGFRILTSVCADDVRDLLHVRSGDVPDAKALKMIKRVLRHKSIQNTMKYSYTLNFKGDGYKIAIVTTIEEIKQFGQVRSVKHNEHNGIHFYRKPKKFRSWQ